MPSTIPQNLQEASTLLENVKGRPQSISERKKLAVDLATLMLNEAVETMTSEEKQVQAQLQHFSFPDWLLMKQAIFG